MLKSGEADIIMSTPYAMAKDVESAGYKTVRLPTHPPTSIRFHTLNTDVPWFKKDVRLAIAMAIDGDAIVKNLFQGIPGRFTRLSPGELGYDPNLKQYPYDPKKSKELLLLGRIPERFRDAALLLYRPDSRTERGCRSSSSLSYCGRHQVQDTGRGSTTDAGYGKGERIDDPKAVNVGTRQLAPWPTCRSRQKLWPQLFTINNG